MLPRVFEYKFEELASVFDLAFPILRDSSFVHGSMSKLPHEFPVISIRSQDDGGVKTHPERTECRWKDVVYGGIHYSQFTCHSKCRPVGVNWFIEKVSGRLDSVQNDNIFIEEFEVNDIAWQYGIIVSQTLRRQGQRTKLVMPLRKSKPWRAWWPIEHITYDWKLSWSRR